MSRGNRPPPRAGAAAPPAERRLRLEAAPVGSSVRARLRPSVCVRMCRGSAAQAQPLPPPARRCLRLSPPPPRGGGAPAPYQIPSPAGLPGPAGSGCRAEPLGPGLPASRPAPCPYKTGLPAAPLTPGTPPLPARTRAARVSLFPFSLLLSALLIINSLIYSSSRRFTAPQTPPAQGRAPAPAAGRVPPWDRAPRALCPPLPGPPEAGRAAGRLHSSSAALPSHLGESRLLFIAGSRGAAGAEHLRLPKHPGGGAPSLHKLFSPSCFLSPAPGLAG